MELISTLGQALFGVLMDKCRNCGHDSHCGVPLWKDYRPEGKGIQGQIEVCKHCRCPRCTIPDWG